MSTTWILDNGHGGMLGAEYYQTAGKRSPVIKKGLGVYEGEFNRDVVKRVLGLCQRHDVHAIDLVPGAQNVPLGERRRRVRELIAVFGEAKLISIHANAAGNGRDWHRAKGPRIFTRRKGARWYAESVELARGLAGEMKLYDLGTPKLRESNFTIIKGPLPSILYEAAFMTNKAEAAKLADDGYRDDTAELIFELMASYCGPVRGLL